MDRRALLFTGIGLAVAGLPGLAVPNEVDRGLIDAVTNPRRSPKNVARDAYRHPLETLTFWGVEPGMTVVEVSPTGGYWTEILAPYLKKGGGRYVAAIDGDPTAFRTRFAESAVWGDIQVSKLFGEPLAPAGTANMVITARNIHDWLSPPGALDGVLRSFREALRPGGVLAVEDHRSDPRPMAQDAADGYVSTAWMVRSVEKAGFKLNASSEVNANPKDDKQHPFGVWTLPPTLRSHAKDQPVAPDYDRAKYIAIGESDRMTLRFIKS